MKSLLLTKIEFEPTFSQVLWRFAFPLPLPAYAPLRSGRQGEAGGRGVWGEFRPPAEATLSDWTISSFSLAANSFT